MKFKLILAATALVLLTGAKQPSTAELGTAMQPWMGCVVKHVRLMDNGESDARSVAFGVRPACAHLYEDVVRLGVQGVATTEGRQIVRQAWKDRELALITNGVLIYRAARADPEISDTIR